MKRILIATAAAIVFVAAIENPAHAGPKMDTAVAMIIAAAPEGCGLPIPTEITDYAIEQAADEESTDVATASDRVGIRALLTLTEWGPEGLDDFCEEVSQ